MSRYFFGYSKCVYFVKFDWNNEIFRCKNSGPFVPWCTEMYEKGSDVEYDGNENWKNK